jgi:uncharacterized protein YkwD
MRRPARSTLQLVLACALAACSRGPQLGGRGPWDGRIADNRTDFAARLLAAQNRERGRLGLAPFRWNPVLAEHAKGWADTLARRDAFEHSKPTNRPGEGENLWKGTSGAYSLEQMIGHFIAERKDFRPGTFPKVAKNGNWRTVAHYTQIIWPATREVGSALTSRKQTDWLVCRYAPVGNVVGQPVG